MTPRLIAGGGGGEGGAGVAGRREGKVLERVVGGVGGGGVECGDAGGASFVGGISEGTSGLMLGSAEAVGWSVLVIGPFSCSAVVSPCPEGAAAAAIVVSPSST